MWDNESAAASYTVTVIKDGKRISSVTTENTSTTICLPTAGKYQIKIYSTNFLGNGEQSTTVLEAEAVDPLTVTFTNYDDSIITTQKVTYGKEAIIPDDPIRKGYTFTEWENIDKATAVKEDLTLKAKYKINTYFMMQVVTKWVAPKELNMGNLRTRPMINLRIFQEDMFLQDGK